MPGTVLVVEDDETIRRLLIECLREHPGLEVDAASDGVDALHHVATRGYGVVVLDLMMPYMTGIDFLHSLSAMLSDPSLRAIPAPPAVIIITSLPEEQVPAEEIEERFPAIVRGVMRKPLDVRELARRIEDLLGA
jgi:CheY-like chemotaxis protein